MSWRPDLAKTAAVVRGVSLVLVLAAIGTCFHVGLKIIREDREEIRRMNDQAKELAFAIQVLHERIVGLEVVADPVSGEIQRKVDLLTQGYSDLREMLKSPDPRIPLIGNRLSELAKQVEELIARVNLHQEEERRKWEEERNSIRTRLEWIEGKLPTQDLSRLLHRVIYPTVQVFSRGGTSSGVVIRSREVDGKWVTTLIATDHGVTANIVNLGGKEVRYEVRVVGYSKDTGNMERFLGTITHRDKPLDVALVDIVTEKEWAFVATPYSGTPDVHTLMPVVLSGFPLGIGPILTDGMVCGWHQDGNGARNILHSTNSMVGNSGGGLFIAETLEYVGMFHMFIRPPSILDNAYYSYLSLSIPLPAIQGWMKTQGLEVWGE